MINRMINVVAAGLLVGSAGLANAEVADGSARLLQVQGKVLINDGARYTPAKSGAEVKTGTKIITAKGATANLVYKNGCVKEVKTNTMLVVGTPAECASMISNERIHVAAAAGEVTLETANRSNAAWLFRDGRWVLVALGTGAVVAVAATNGGDGSNPPPLPPATPATPPPV